MTASSLGALTGLFEGLSDPAALLNGWGHWALLGIAIVVFIESGVLFPFLPGDSLIFTAGMLHVALGLNPVVIALVVWGSAFCGDQVGYFLGIKFGRRLFKDDARVLKTKHLNKAEAFFAKWGGPSLILARFVPLVRTYTPLSAGIAKFPYRRFLFWSPFGGFLWAAIMTTAGVLLGGVPFIANNVDVVAIVIVLVSLTPIMITVGRTALAKRKASRRPEQQAPEDDDTITTTVPRIDIDA